MRYLEITYSDQRCFSFDMNTLYGRWVYDFRVYYAHNDLTRVGLTNILGGRKNCYLYFFSCSCSNVKIFNVLGNIIL